MNISTIFALIILSIASPNSHADVPVDLRGRPKEFKLVIHACDGISEHQLKSAKCSMISDINYSTAVTALSKKTDFPVIVSPEQIDVKKGVNPNTFEVTGVPYWQTCDGEDGDCIEWSTGGFANHVENFFSITTAQQKSILTKLIENSSRQNTNLYFFRRDVSIDQRNSEGIFTYFDLRNAKVHLK